MNNKRKLEKRNVKFIKQKQTKALLQELQEMSQEAQVFIETELGPGSQGK